MGLGTSWMLHPGRWERRSLVYDLGRETREQVVTVPMGHKGGWLHWGQLRP